MRIFFFYANPNANSGGNGRLDRMSRGFLSSYSLAGEEHI